MTKYPNPTLLEEISTEICYKGSTTEPSIVLNISQTPNSSSSIVDTSIVLDKVESGQFVLWMFTKCHNIEWENTEFGLICSTIRFKFWTRPVFCANPTKRHLILLEVDSIDAITDKLLWRDTSEWRNLFKSDKSTSISDQQSKKGVTWHELLSFCRYCFIQWLDWTKCFAKY